MLRLKFINFKTSDQSSVIIQTDRQTHAAEEQNIPLGRKSLGLNHIVKLICKTNLKINTDLLNKKQCYVWEEPR